MFRDTKVFSSYSFAPSAKVKNFYSEILDMKVSESPMGLALHPAGGGDVFLYPKPDHVPAAFTVLNFVVDDVERAVAELKKRAVVFEHYSAPKTDEDGIHRNPDGPWIAWFKDPAGNILSVLQEKPGRIKVKP